MNADSLLGHSRSGFVRHAGIVPDRRGRVGEGGSRGVPAEVNHTPNLFIKIYCWIFTFLLTLVSFYGIIGYRAH